MAFTPPTPITTKATTYCIWLHSGEKVMFVSGGDGRTAPENLMKSLQNREPLSIKNLPVKHNNSPTISGASFGVGNPNSEINTSLGEVSGGDGVTGVGSVWCGQSRK
ncbi:hypothetical protein HanRHA438_Chr04g0157021 [Helianthus annuus]|nr:hypothetical protein HanRHA438_Chr04g0157021 [Helianthus annuus]